MSFYEQYSDITGHHYGEFGLGLDLYICLDCGYFGPDPNPNSPYSFDLICQHQAYKKT